MRRLLGLGLLAIGVTAAVVIGARLSRAVGELASIAAVVDVSQVEMLSLEPPALVPPAIATQAPAEVAPLEPTSDAAGDDGPPPLEESELALEYFGDAVSLNDLGQLQSPDPEFDRAMRELANDRGEIEARD